MNHVIYPDDFDDYAWELAYKGHFEVPSVVDGDVKTVSFYDRHRLRQDREFSEELGDDISAEIIIVVDVVDREHMDAAIRSFRP